MAWRHKASTWTNYELSPEGSQGKSIGNTQYINHWNEFEYYSFLNYCHSSQWPMSERVNYLLSLVITQKLSCEVPWISWSVLEQRSATVEPSLLKTIYHTYCHKVFAGVGASIGRFDIQKVNETPKNINEWMNWFIPLNRLCNIRENDTKLKVHFAWRKALGPTAYPVLINICMSNLDSLEPVVIQFRPKHC